MVVDALAPFLTRNTTFAVPSSGFSWRASLIRAVLLFIKALAPVARPPRILFLSATQLLAVVPVQKAAARVVVPAPFHSVCALFILAVTFIP